MVEFAIDVKHSAYRISKQDAEKQKKVTRVCAYIFLALMLPLSAFCLHVTIVADKPDAPHWMLTYLEVFLPTMFSLLSIGLFLASGSAIMTMRRYFDERI